MCLHTSLMQYPLFMLSTKQQPDSFIHFQMVESSKYLLIQFSLYLLYLLLILVSLYWVQYDYSGSTIVYLLGSPVRRGLKPYIPILAHIGILFHKCVSVTTVYLFFISKSTNLLLYCSNYYAMQTNWLVHNLQWFADHY